jgi:hypothetical protein
MARTKDDVKAAAAAAVAAVTPGDDGPKRRGRPAKDVTDADTGAGVKKPAGKRGRPAGANPKPKAKAADGPAKPRGRPPGSANKVPKTPGVKKASSSAGAKKEFLPAIPAQESTTGADRRRAKMADNKLQSLPDVKRVVNPNDGRRKNKGPGKSAPKGVTPKKTATSPVKRDSPAVGKASSPVGVAGE